MPDQDPLSVGELFISLQNGPIVYRAEILLPKNKVYASYADVLDDKRNLKKEIVLSLEPGKFLAAGAGYEIRFGVTDPSPEDFIFCQHTWLPYKEAGKQWGTKIYTDAVTIWRVPMKDKAT